MAQNKGVQLIHPIRIDAASTNITTAAWLEVVATLDDDIAFIQITNNAADDFKLGVGAAGVEDDYIYVSKSSSIEKEVNISKDLRLSARSIGANITTGTVIINLWG